MLYEYQPSRNADHPREFLKGFDGICVTDGYQIYYTIEKERENLKIAECWVQARRWFDEAMKAKWENALAYLVLKQIQAIIPRGKQTCGHVPGGTPVAPLAYSKALVDAYFAWIKQNLTRRLCERGDRKYNFTRR